MSAYAATKAGVEALCNALRVEVAHHGVTVGAVHPAWVSTPMVAEGHDLTAFRRLRAAMPSALRRDLGLDEAAELIATGLAERRDRVYVPGWVRLLRWLRTPLHTRGAERDMRKAMPQIEAAFHADLSEHGTALASARQRHR
jgi:NAD(P)-dependent dehydrogenase (short-subunit alcohol dehydrogenase family)